MPVYAWSCDQGHEAEGYVPLTTSGTPPCAECGGATEKIWKVTSHHAASVYPYEVKDKKGNVVTIDGPAALKRYCRENNLTHRPDAAWITTRFEGFDFKTGKQRYTESSGLGLPGCWV